MDPNACLIRLLEAIAEKDELEARDALAELTRWINRGGFLPHAAPAAAFVRALGGAARHTAD